MEAGEPLQEAGLAPELTEATTTGLRVLTLPLGSYAIGFVFSVMISRAVGPTGRGLYALPLAILGVLIALSHLGLEHSNICLASQRASLRRLWANATISSVVVGSVWLIVTVLYLSDPNLLEAHFIPPRVVLSALPEGGAL